MKMPPLLMGSALLFWGLASDNLLIGAVLCLLLEGSNLLTTRYTLSDEDFIKISDVTSLVFLGAIALILLNYKPVNFLRITAGWLPLILLPLIAAQLYSTGDTIVIGTRLARKKKVHAHQPVDFRFYYIAVCIFAAATGNNRALWFYPILALLLLWLLWHNRGRAFAPVVFFLVGTIVFGFGYVATLGMEMAHRQVIEKSRHFWRGYYRERHSDPFKSHVNFGETGRLKESGEIIMRVAASAAPPRLLKEASYTMFARGNWLGNQEGFAFLAPLDATSWNLLAPPHREGQTIGVEFKLPKEKGLLPQPYGGYQLHSQTIFEVEKNTSGVVKVVDGAAVISYDLSYHPEMRDDIDLPRPRNLQVPDDEKYALEAVIDRMGAAKLADSAKIAALRQYFLKDFSYSLNLLGKEEYATPLGNFLLHRKSGFCEYYATATTLLLRMMGIPSRYVVGYAVIERSWLERRYVVRERHAHAWAEAFVDERWLVVDTTPPNWAEQDGQGASAFEGIADIFSFIRHKYQLFRIGSGTDYTLVFSVIVVVLTTFLAARIYRRIKMERAEREKEGLSERSFARIISPLTPVIDLLLQSAVARGEDETFVDWASRTSPWHGFDRSEFAVLYRLHLRMRYDPAGLSAAEEERLRLGVERFLVGKEIETAEKKAALQG